MNIETFLKTIVGPAIEQAWSENYPPNVAPWKVRGRKMWRKNRLVQIIMCKMPAMLNSEIAAFVKACGPLDYTDNTPKPKES